MGGILDGVLDYESPLPRGVSQPYRVTSLILWRVTNAAFVPEMDAISGGRRQSVITAKIHRLTLIDV